MKIQDKNTDYPRRPADADETDIQACSATDCTGLIPAAPQTEEERENYEELYPYLPRAAVPADKEKKSSSSQGNAD